MAHGRRFSTATTDTSGSLNGMWDPNEDDQSIAGTDYTEYTHYPADFDPEPAPILSLPCEFAGVKSCGERFSSDNRGTEEWIEHVIGHFGHLLPQKSMCWFCDEVCFDAQQNSGNLESTFVYRMWHIRDHIADGYTEDDIRPDYLLFEHLHRSRLITKEQYQRVKAWRERIPLPGGDIAIPDNPYPTSSSRRQSSRNDPYGGYGGYGNGAEIAGSGRRRHHSHRGHR